MHAMDTGVASKPNKLSIPLWLQVLLCVLIGTAIGVLLGKTSPLGPDPGRTKWLDTAGGTGMLVIQVLRALAVPLVFFAIIDGIVHISIPKRSIPKLLAVCALNTSIAMLIGLTLMNTLQPGKAWQGKIQSLISATNAKAPDAKKSDDPASPGATLEILPNITYIVPSSLLRPFVYNNLLSVVLIAVLLGSALRAIRQKGIDGAELLERAVHACYHLLLQMLEWTIKAIPLAVLLIVSKVVGNTGPGIFTLLGGFLGIVVAGLLIHALVYYPIAAWIFGRRNPATYFGKSADAVISGLSTNSSLATVPITLRCLEKLGVSHGNARLSACIATNLNNDGITLYEAMAAIFLTQALGMPLGLTGQITVVLASCFAAAGIAGIPEAGLIVLPLVLGAAGLTPETVAIALPLLLPVDWIIARLRSGVNVLSDILVAIQLDGPEKQTPKS